MKQNIEGTQGIEGTQSTQGTQSKGSSARMISVKHGDTKAGLPPGPTWCGCACLGGQHSPRAVNQHQMCVRGEQGESLRQTTATAAAETAWLLSESRFSPRSLLLFTAWSGLGGLYCSKRSREFALKATRGASESLASTCRCVSTPSCTHAHARGHQHTCAELFFCVSASGPGFQQQEAEPRPLLLLACSPPVASGAAAGTPAAPRHGSAGEEAFERPG